MRAFCLSAIRNNARNKAAIFPALAEHDGLLQREALVTWKAWDWKFVATTVIAIAALVAPQIDLSSRSLAVRLTATSSLQPAVNIQNLQISINGHDVESPYISTIELVNNGSKPILSSDFDGALQIRMANDAKLISAEITSTTPKNIPAQITTSGNGAAIAPFLSNPNDSITIAAITSGPRPAFEVRARIVGINEVGLEDNTVRDSSYWSSFFNVVAANGLVFLYFVFLPIAYRYKQFTIPRGLAFCTAALCAFTSVKIINLTTMKQIFTGVPYAPIWAVVVGFGLIVVMAILAGKYLRRLMKADRLKG
jgi:hypothetical protein